MFYDIKLIKNYNVLISIVIILLLLSTPIFLFWGAISYTPEHIVKKEGEKENEEKNKLHIDNSCNIGNYTCTFSF